MHNKFTQTMLYLLLFILLLAAMDVDAWFLTWASIFLHRIVAALHWCASHVMNSLFVAEM